MSSVELRPVADFEIDAEEPIASIAAMDDRLAAWVDRGLERKGKGAATALAKITGLSADKITKVRKGERRIQSTELPKFERFFGEKAPIDRQIDPATAMTPAPKEPAPTVSRVVGYAGANNEVHFYNIGQGDFDEVPAPPGASGSTVAVEIRGQSWGAEYDRSLAFYEDLRREITPDLYGRICIIGLPSGGVVMKTLRRGRKPNRYTLVSANADPMEDVEVDWAAPVTNIQFRK